MSIVYCQWLLPQNFEDFLKHLQVDCNFYELACTLKFFLFYYRYGNFMNHLLFVENLIFLMNLFILFVKIFISYIWLLYIKAKLLFKRLLSTNWGFWSPADDYRNAKVHAGLGMSPLDSWGDPWRTEITVQAVQTIKKPLDSAEQSKQVKGRPSTTSTSSSWGSHLGCFCINFPDYLTYQGSVKPRRAEGIPGPGSRESESSVSQARKHGYRRKWMSHMLGPSWTETALSAVWTSPNR